MNPFDWIFRLPPEAWLWAGVVVVVGWIAAELTIAPLDEDAPLSNLDRADGLREVTRCGHFSPEGWACDRAAGHDGSHIDSTKGGELGSARWVGGDAA